MILWDNDEIEFDDEDDIESMSSLKDVDDEEYIAQGELLVLRRALRMQVKEDDKVQWENIFHSRCHVQNKVCSIDASGCTNVATTIMI